VSKFFYGGYTLENFEGMRPHIHSNIAKSIVNKLVVGRVMKDSNEFFCRVVNRMKVNEFTETIIFRCDKKIPGLRLFHADLNMLGKHYTVRKMSHQHLKRNYTLSNCMRADVYDEYLRLLSDYHDNVEDQHFRSSFIRGEDGTDLVITIKNYKKEGGLSKMIFDCSPEDLFIINGPMGKGLDLGNTGTHIVFVAGTGCLVFIDLIAHLVRKYLGLLTELESTYFDYDNFKLMMYISYHRREDSIGLELIEALDSFCRN